MSAPTPSEAEPELAPIDYVVIEFEELQPDGEALQIVLDLVDRGIIRVLDVEIIKRNEDGSVVGMRAEDVDQQGVGSFELFAGASTGLFSQDDFDAVGAILLPGATAVALLYENTWAIPFVRSVRSKGGQVIANGRVTVNDLLAALESKED